MKTPRLALLLFAAVLMTPAATWAQPEPPAPPKPPKPPKPPVEGKAADQGPEQTERIVRTFKAAEATVVVLANVSGDITVSAGPAGEVKVEAVKRARASDPAEAKRQLERTQVEFDERAGRIEVRATGRADESGRSWTRVSVDYAVSVPPRTELEIKSVSGDIRLAGTRGEVMAETVSGDIVASGLAQRVALKSVSGDVSASDVDLADRLAVNSVSGDIEVKAFKAKSLDAGSVSGGVRLLDGTCDRAIAQSMSGDIEVQGGVVKGGRYDLKSHSGDVRLVLDGKVGFELDASSFSGSIKSDLPLTVSGEAASHGSRRSMRGTYGDGSAKIEAVTFSGDVSIVKR